jgi:hypothetical protein
MSAIKLDHVPLLEGNKNYSEWAKSMRYALLAEDNRSVQHPGVWHHQTTSHGQEQGRRHHRCSALHGERCQSELIDKAALIFLSHIKPSIKM